MSLAFDRVLNTRKLSQRNRKEAIERRYRQYLRIGRQREHGKTNGLLFAFIQWMTNQLVAMPVASKEWSKASRRSDDKERWTRSILDQGDWHRPRESQGVAGLALSAPLTLELIFETA
jgi:hypothetical protein